METQLLAKPIRDQEIKNLKQKCIELKERGINPNLQVVLVGNNPASLIYTKKKKKFFEKFGATCDIIHLSEDINEDEFLKTITSISNNKSVHGCFIQLPLPQKLNHVDVATLIPKNKDVDGFHPLNIFSILRGIEDEFTLIPCTPKGIISLLDFYQIPIQGKNVVIIGRSMIVGKPMQMLLTNRNATVTLCHSKTSNIHEVSKNADIIISAIGKANYITKEFINEKTNHQIVIDVGINHDENGKICGDVDYEDVKHLVKAITPVPGGVGPLTILSLAQNLLQAAEKNI